MFPTMTRALVILLLTVTVPTPATAADPAPSDALGAVEKGVRAEQASQRLADQWAQKKQELLREVRDLKTRTAWLEFQRDKYQAYIETQHQSIAELTRRKAELRTVRDELEPFLTRLVDRLGAFVAADLPMLAEERAQRVAFLRASLADYHLSLSEKLRRVLEALQIEADYGKSVERIDTSIPLDGVQTRVTLLHLGRLALFYTTADGARMGRWDPAGKTWVDLDEKYRRELRHALEMANRRRTVELLRLPVEAGSVPEGGQ